MRASWTYTKTYKELSKKYDEKECSLIGDALFTLFHPMSDFSEQNINERKLLVQEEILKTIELDSLEKYCEMYKQEVLSRESRIYMQLSNTLDYTLAATEQIREKRVGKMQFNITPALLKELTVFISKYGSLKEQLSLERKVAKKTIDRKTFGNIALSASDERFSRS